MADLVMPDPVLVAGEWLRAQAAITDVVGKRVARRLTGTYPAIRLTDLGPIEQGPEEALVRVQVECWSEDYFEAQQLAATVVSVRPEARGEWLLDDAGAVGYCAGATVVSGPFANPDPDSERFRHQLDVALQLHPLAP